jgi:hypothetical protein
MPNERLKRKSFKMLTTGMSLMQAPDFMSEGKFPFLQNIRVNKDGTIESRERLSSLAVLAGGLTFGIHSIKRLNDKATGKWHRLLGAGIRLYAELSTAPGTANEIAVGLSGNPINIIDFRPEAVVSPYSYVFDSNTLFKVAPDGSTSGIGLDVPGKAPTAILDKPIRTIIDEINAASLASWVQSGSAGVPTNPARINTTLTAIIPDGAYPNWANIVPAALTKEMQEGAIVLINGVDSYIIERVYKSALKAGIATVRGVRYYAGVTGKCVINLTTPVKDMEVNSIALINGNYYRILSVTHGKDGLTSFVIDSGGVTIVVGNTVSIADSFRIYANNTYAVGVAIVGDGLKTVIGASGLSAIKKTANFDMTLAGSSNVNLDLNDIFHISLRVSNPANLTEIQVRLYLGDTDNYFYFPITPNLLSASVDQSSSTLSVQRQAVIDSEVINPISEVSRPLLARLYRGDDIYAPDIQEIADRLHPFRLVPVEGTITETPLGANIWGEFKIPFKRFTRVGNSSKGFKDISAIEISITTTGALDLYLDSIWIGGGFGLNSEGIDNPNPYNWVYRVIDNVSKTKSDWSAPIRNPIHILRNRVLLKAESYADYSSSYLIEWARYGGNLYDFRIVGRQKADGSYFVDSYADTIIAANDAAVFGKRKTFTLIDKTKTGFCNVVGTVLTVTSGDNLSARYAIGTNITVNGIENTFFAPPNAIANNVVELLDDMGVLTGVPFRIEEPILTGQPLPVVFGPFGSGFFGLIYFGLGDSNAPNKIYWTEGNNLDQMDSDNFLEITSPSESLIGGAMWDGIPYVWSNRRSFALYPRIDSNGVLVFEARENAGSKGLFSRNAICVGKKGIYYLNNQGSLDVVAGNGIPASLSDEHFKIFFDESKNVIIKLIDGSVVTISPPNWTLPDEIRLYAANNLIFFRYKTVAGVISLLVYSERLEGFISFDTVASPQEFNCIYFEEAENLNRTLVGLNGTLAYYSSAVGIEGNVSSRIMLPLFDESDSRRLKKFWELVLRAIPGSNGFSVIPYFDYYNNAGATVNITNEIFPLPISPQEFLINLNANNGYRSKNISAIINWPLNYTTDSPRFYEIEYSYFDIIETIQRVDTDFYYGNTQGEKEFTELILTAYTYGVNKSFNIVTDDGIVIQALTINHTQEEQTKSYPMTTPFVAHGVKLVSTDSNNWEFYNQQWKYEQWEENISSYLFWDDGGVPDYKFLHGFELLAHTANAEIPFDILGDDGVVLESFVSRRHNGKVNLSYAFTTPRRTHAMRIVKKGNMRIFAVKWLFDLEPELAKVWKSQDTTHGVKGVHHLQKAKIAYRSLADVTLNLYIDGVLAKAYMLPNSNGNFKKLPFFFEAKKGLFFRYEFVSTLDLQIYKNLCEVWIKEFNSDEAYSVINPFGGESNRANVPI